jgi:ribonuclease HII
VKSKADSLYKCVSAASIAAKYIRDKELDEWVYEEPLGLPEK